MTEHDAQRSRAQRPRRAREIAGLERQCFGAHQSCDGGPAGEAHDHDDAIEREGFRLGDLGWHADLARVDGGQHDQQREQGERNHAVGEPHQDRVQPAAEIAGEDTDHGAQDRRQQGPGYADQKRDAPSVEQALEKVAAEIVGAQPVSGRWRLEAAEQVGRGRVDAAQLGDQRSGQRQEQQEGQEDQRDPRQAVAQQALQDEAARAEGGHGASFPNETRGSTQT